MARDFEDDERDFGGAAVRAAIDQAQWPWPVAPEPVDMAEPGAPITFKATPFAWRDPATIPRRQFLYSFQLRRGQVSSLISPGATGKTTFKVGRALCMVTGRDLLGHRVWNGPHRVWLWNLEDEMEEVEKTVHAFMKLWNLTAADLADRLFLDGIDSAGTPNLKLAIEDKNGGFIVRRPVSEAVIEEMIARSIDYLDVDPFVSSHAVNENDNGAIDAVTKEWLRIAHASHAAVNLTHHVRKPNGGEISAFDARGAVSMINAARSVLVFQKMTKEVATEFRIPECDRKRFFSVIDDKNNKAPPTSKADWYEFVGIGLGNGDDTGPEDNIGAIQRWQAPDTFGGVSVRQLRHIQEMVNTQPEKARKHSSSPLWVGKLVAFVLDRNLDEAGEKENIKKMIGTWLATGALKTVERKDGHSETKEYVEVGEWAIVE
ncbi:AAA family ATPase [Sphingomonas histidinilytica]|uniref:AAA family ATPase n=1 Tax=Rhizorhabdus histidinilytica TaxID=439228 RepID=UPI001ADC0115|nr:AAA family ATPase [Rhizorhabdus histidinilytica]MBO9377693.1 AAA family ATPase [Rhizorhabdus histidinilytica]